MYVDRRRCEQSSSCIAVMNRCTEDAAAAAAAVAVIYIHLATTQDGSWLRKKRRR